MIATQAAGWLRCRVTEAEPGQPAYSQSPKITRLAAFTIGGTVEAMHAEVIEGEVLGLAEGIPGERFPLKRRPVVAEEGFRVLEVAGDEGWEEWNEVPNFAESAPADHHFQVDAATGEVLLGPAVREAHCISSEPCRRRGGFSSYAHIGQVEGVAATSSLGRFECSSPRSPTSRGSRTATRLSAVWTRKISPVPK